MHDCSQYTVGEWCRTAVSTLLVSDAGLQSVHCWWVMQDCSSTLLVSDAGLQSVHCWWVLQDCSQYTVGECCKTAVNTLLVSDAGLCQYTVGEWCTLLAQQKINILQSLAVGYCWAFLSYCDINSTIITLLFTITTTQLLKAINRYQ